jgi:hypothetical protein
MVLHGETMRYTRESLNEETTQINSIPMYSNVNSQQYSIKSGGSHTNTAKVTMASESTIRMLFTLDG